MKRSSLFFAYAFALIVTPSLQSLHAAPLAWFPGPSLDWPVSGAAATTISGGSILLVGGESFNAPNASPKSLAVTNLSWNYLPVMYGATIAPGVLGGGDPVVVYGGTDGTASTSAVFSYSQSGDGQSALASMSVARSYLGYATDGNGRGYALGGLDDAGQPLSSAERYDVDANTWSAIASLPTALYNFPAVFDHTNQIYIFGGYTDTSSGIESAAAYRYSVKSNTWTAIAPMPVAVAGSAAALGVDGKIYVAGGVSGGIATSIVQVYNPVANSWTLSTPLPEALSASAMSVDSLGRLILIGGIDTNGNDVADVWHSQLLGTPDSVPTFTQYPATNGAYQAPYNSSIAAIGNPQPTYVVYAGPTNMVVDPYSGVITWTPAGNQIGTNAVTIRATNFAGYVDWNFTIVVTPPPPTVPTNLTVVSVTDNSVTLSWAPEDPVVGPVSYDVYVVHPGSHGGKGSAGPPTYSLLSSIGSINTITISSLAPGSSQGYVVKAVGASGSTGYSTEVFVTTTSPQGPPALTVTGLTSTTVSLAWNPSPGPTVNPNFSTITSYSITERIGTSNFPRLTGITGTNGTITGLTPGSSHLWFVSGVDAYGYASSSVFPYVVVVNPVPVSPQLSIAPPSIGGSFSFTASEGGTALQTVIIQASTNPADPNSWVQIGSLLPATNPFTFTDTNAAQFSSRFYRVIAP